MNRNTFFIQALIAWRRAMKPNVRAITRKTKQPTWLYPWAYERRYTQLLHGWMSKVIQFTEDYVKQQAQSILRGDSETHTDALPGPGFVLLTKTLAGWISQYYPDPETNRSPSGIMMGLSSTSNGVKAFCEKQWGKQTDPILGFQFNTAEPWWPTVRQNWSDMNYKLIKTISQQYIGKVNDIVEKAVTNGWHYETLMKDIKKQGYNLQTWQIKRLARDQIGKLNGQIAQAQQEDAGVDWYIWETAGDERVRGNPTGRFPKAIPSHWIMQSILCKWSDATVYSIDKGKTWIPRTAKMPKAHPGQEIQCRCVPIPYFAAMLNEVDAAFGDAITPGPLPIASPKKKQMEKTKPSSSQPRTIVKPTSANQAYIEQMQIDLKKAYSLGGSVKTRDGIGVVKEFSKSGKVMFVELPSGKTIKAFRSWSRGFGMNVYRYNERIIWLAKGGT